MGLEPGEVDRRRPGLYLAAAAVGVGMVGLGGWMRWGDTIVPSAPASQQRQPAGPPGGDPPPGGGQGVRPSTETSVGAAALEPILNLKVREIVERSRTLQVRPAGDTRPEVVILGSSSTGDDHLSFAWPAKLQAARPDLWVHVLAKGGATSWHMAQVMDTLDIHAAACVAYLGHNDTNPAIPGGSILQVLGGHGEATLSLRPPIAIEELPELWSRITARCGLTLVMAEYSRDREAALAEWAQAVAAVPGVTFRDGGALIGERQLVGDGLHPSPEGHEVLAGFVRTELETLLPPAP